MDSPGLTCGQERNDVLVPHLEQGCRDSRGPEHRTDDGAAIDDDQPPPLDPSGPKAKLCSFRDRHAANWMRLTLLECPDGQP